MPYGDKQRCLVWNHGLLTGQPGGHRGIDVLSLSLSNTAAMLTGKSCFYFLLIFYSVSCGKLLFDCCVQGKLNFCSLYYFSSYARGVLALRRICSQDTVTCLFWQHTYLCPLCACRVSRIRNICCVLGKKRRCSWKAIFRAVQKCFFAQDIILLFFHEILHVHIGHGHTHAYFILENSLCQPLIHQPVQHVPVRGLPYHFLWRAHLPCWLSAHPPCAAVGETLHFIK